MRKIVALIFILFSILNKAFALRVHPIRLYLDDQNKTDSITVENDTEKKCKIQVTLFKWIQNQEGRDLFEPTRDIIFYPHLLIMEPQERRIIRIGAKVNTKGRELCYRLYVEELPEFEFGRRIPIFDEEGEEKQNMNVRMLTRFGIPIFLQPKKKILKGDIEKVFLENKRLKILISNKGNINFSPKNIKIAFINNRNRKEISSDIERWYLLSGAKRWYEIEIPKKVFIDNATIMEVEVKTNKFIFEKRLEKYFTKISY